MKGDAVGFGIICGYTGGDWGEKVENGVEGVCEDRSERLEGVFKEFRMSSGFSPLSYLSWRVGIAFSKNCFHFFIRLVCESGVGGTLGPHSIPFLWQLEHGCMGSWYSH